MNKEELTYGFVIGALTTWFLWPYNLIIGVLCALLWAVSGMHGQAKVWRRLGVPFVITAVGAFHHPTYWLMLSLIAGYGIPDASDSGSALGRFWIRLVGEHASIFTRATILLGLAVVFYPVWRM